MSRWRRRWRAVAVALVLGGLALPAPASADEQPAILKAYDLDWIERVRDDAWPQPKEQRPVICLLDTGVNVTPDTPDNNPAGPIVARLALDGGTGLAQGTSWEHLHGTEMASIIAAPRNGYGTVGVFPQARIVSIRVTDQRSEEVFISPARVVAGVIMCRTWTLANNASAAAVVVPEANYDQRPSDTDVWMTAGQRAEEAGALLVAAAGNSSDAKTLAPLGVPGLVAVTAGGADGLACSFVADAEQSSGLRAPGCQARGWSDGSSAATAVTGAFVAALAYSGGETALERKEELLDQAAPADGAIGRLSGSKFRERLGNHIDPLPPTSTPAQALTSAIVAPDVGDNELEVRMWKPRLRVTWSNGLLRVVRTGGLSGRLVVRLSRGSKQSTAARFGRRFAIAVDKRPKRIEAWAEGREGGWRSLTVRCRVDSP